MNLSKNQFVKRQSYQHPGAGNTITHEIDKGGFVHEILVIARGTIVDKGGSAAGVATGRYNPQSLVSQFEVIANPKSYYPGGTLKRVLPRTVCAREIFAGGRFLGDIGNATITATGNSTVEIPYLLRFSLPELLKPAETSLYTDMYSGLSLVISLNDITALFSGNDHNFDFSGVTFDVYDRRSAGSPFGDDVAVLFERDIIVPIGGANGDWNIKDFLPNTQPVYDVLVVTEADNYALADSILKEVKMIEDGSGTPFLRGVKPGAIKFGQRHSIKDAAQSDVGLYLLPIANDGMLRQVVDGIRPTVDVANPSGANKDRLILNVRGIALPETFAPQKKK